jgi:hypothetical protein
MTTDNLPAPPGCIKPSDEFLDEIFEEVARCAEALQMDGSQVELLTEITAVLTPWLDDDAGEAATLAAWLMIHLKRHGWTFAKGGGNG